MKTGQKIARVTMLTMLMVFLSGYCVSAATFTVNPGQSIQTAINAAPDGSKIKIKAGTYNEVLLIDNRAKLKLIGAGAGKTIIDGNGIGADLVVIRNSEKITLQKSTFTRGQGNNFFIDNSHSVKILSNEIFNAVGIGIFYLGGSDLTIKNNQIMNSGGDGINFALFSYHNLIMKNTITGNGGVGIQHVLGDNDKIFNNIVSSNTGGGIQNQQGSVQVKSNTIEDNTGPGIVDNVFSSYQNVYMKNIVQRNDIGIMVLGGTRLLKNIVADNPGGQIIANAHGNTLIGNFTGVVTAGVVSGIGVMMNGEGNYAKGNYVRGILGPGFQAGGTSQLLKNKAFFNSFGIILNGNMLTVVSGNNCSNNDWGMNGNGAMSTMYTKNKVNTNLQGMTGLGPFNYFARNTVKNNANGGVDASGAPFLTVEKNMITGNTNGDGFFNFANSLVSRNKILNNERHGINASSGAFSLIEKNKVKGNGDGATWFDLYDSPPTDDWWQNNKYLTESL